MASKPESRLLERLDDDLASDIGAACVELLGNRTWIRRRTEQIASHDYDTVRISSTLDIVLPAGVIGRLELDRVRGSDKAVANPPPLTGAKRRLVVPLDSLRKGRLVHFDLSLDGRPASLLS